MLVVAARLPAQNALLERFQGWDRQIATIVRLGISRPKDSKSVLRVPQVNPELLIAMLGALPASLVPILLPLLPARVLTVTLESTPRVLAALVVWCVIKASIAMQIRRVVRLALKESTACQGQDPATSVPPGSSRMGLWLVPPAQQDLTLNRRLRRLVLTVRQAR